MISYTIEAALKSEIFEKVIVSTDSEKIADIAIKRGADVPFIRPDNISGDLISSDEVILHAINFFKNNNIVFKEVCKLQPTSPFRNAEHIREAYHLFGTKKADFVVSVCECEHSPKWTGTLGKDLSMDDFITTDIKRSCRQALPDYYRLNGAIYMARTPAFCKEKSFFGPNGYAYIMKQIDSVDIDTHLDFKIAEYILREIKGEFV